MKLLYYEHTCACGCGKQIEIKKSHRKNKLPKYINGHNRRKNIRKCGRSGCDNLILHSNKVFCSKECFSINRSENNPAKRKEVREKISKSNTGKKHTEEHNKKIGEGNKGKKVSEETRQKISNSNKGHIVSEETKNKLRGRKHTEKAIQKIKEKSILMWQNPEIREKILNSYPDRKGSSSALWLGGKSFEKYPQEFKYIRESILERDDYICQNPECKIHIGYYQRLDVHHIDYDKKNNNSENLVTLCISCHTKTNINREYYTKYYQEILTIYL